MAAEALNLHKQAALVTGAASGLGRASAMALARAGASVAVNHLAGDSAAAQNVVKQIETAGGDAFAVAGDVSNESDVEAMFGEIISRFGTIHILVNNAGIQRDAAFSDMSLEDWQKVIDVNLTGQFLCARASVREFLRRGLQKDISRALGKIICISSVHQTIPWAYHANYAASKGGVTLLMETIAQELARHKIRVNSIAPGAIRTPINQSVWSGEESMSELLRLIPYGRIGEPDDIANTVVWLASDMSDYINGATIVVDGGMTLYPGFLGNG